jgi:mycofactocin precursor
MTVADTGADSAPARPAAEGIEEPVPTEHPAHPAPVEHTTLVEDELLVEEISIDGMCGVY